VTASAVPYRSPGETMMADTMKIGAPVKKQFDIVSFRFSSTGTSLSSARAGSSADRDQYKKFSVLLNSDNFPSPLLNVLHNGQIISDMEIKLYHDKGKKFVIFNYSNLLISSIVFSSVGKDTIVEFHAETFSIKH
jgi:type VI protein secretion system component Hcp